MQPSLGGICLSFFLSVGELQAPCTKENEFPESVRRCPAEGFSPHRIDNQGGRPPYLKAAIVPGQGGRLCRGPTLALALWRRLSFGKDGHQAEGFSPHRTKIQGGLPPYLEAVCRLMPSACRRHQAAGGGYLLASF